MNGPGGPLAGAGGAKRREEHRPPAARVASFLIWWVILMAFWVWIDDTLLTAELVVGAAAAAIGAGFLELAQYQAASHIRIRAAWLGPGLRLPFEILRDTGIVLLALMRQLATGHSPPSGFEVMTVEPGDDSDEGETRRALIIGATSLAPNTYALGIDGEEMVVHRLVRQGPNREKGGA